MREKNCIAHLTIQCCTHTHTPDFINSQRFWTDIESMWYSTHFVRVWNWKTSWKRTFLWNWINVWFSISLSFVLFCYAGRMFSTYLWTKYHIPHCSLSMAPLADMHAHCTRLFDFVTYNLDEKYMMAFHAGIYPYTDKFSIHEFLTFKE